MLCNSLFSETTAPKARHILPASHPRLNLSPIPKASFPPSGQVQGPQAARWLHSLRVNQTAGRPNPFLPPGGLASSPRRCASRPRPHGPADLSVPPVRGGRPGRASPRLARPKAPGPCPTPAARPPRGARGAGANKAARPRHVPAGGRGALPGDPPRGRQAREQQGQGRGSELRAPATPLPRKMEPAGALARAGPTGPRGPVLGLRPGARRRQAGGGLARGPPLRDPAHKEPRRGPAPAPRPGPQRERPRRRRAAPARAGGRAGGRRVPPAAAALAARTAPGGDGHFIRAKVESV